MVKNKFNIKLTVQKKIEEEDEDKSQRYELIRYGFFLIFFLPMPTKVILI